MTKSDSIVLVVPCYNEADRFSAVSFNDFMVSHPNISFLFINDGSTDDTLERLSACCDGMGGQSRVISLKSNSGKAEAVRQGVLEVIDESYEYIGYWDADLSAPLKEIDNLLLSLKESKLDVAIGSRVKLLGHEIDRRLHRHLTGRVFATLASYILGLPVYDTQCGAKIFANNRFLSAVFRDPFITGWSFDVEILKRYKILYQITETTMNILEVPLGSWAHIPDSKVKALDFFYAIYDLYRINLHYDNRRIIEQYRQQISPA